VRQRKPALGHHLHEITKAEFVPQIPPHAEHDDLPVEMAAFEKIIKLQHAWPGSSRANLPPNMRHTHASHQNLLLDNQLPGMSGIELLSQIVAATKDLTVIMITAYGDVPTAVSAMRAGAFHFVQKPFDAEALLAAVEEALSRTDETRDDPHEIKEFIARQALLTQREREVLALLLEGLPTKFIAQQLGINSRTAEHHRAAVIQKMQARNISHLMQMAFTARNLNGSGRAQK
jgi:two-component system response regulator FixJ